MKKTIKFLVILVGITTFLLASLFIVHNIRINKTIQEIENNAITEISSTDNLPKVIQNDETLGTLTIPSINLIKAPIKEGTELSTLAEAIGHFSSTSLLSGNVGLASHNRGSDANYFANIHKLKKGDIIYFENIYGTKKYIVETSTTIDETDWSYLQETKNNRITLITCVKNMPTKRYCVQALETGI